MAELNAYEDLHSAVLINEDESIEVHFHRGAEECNSLDKIACGEYFLSLRNEQRKKTKIIRMLREQCERLESEVSKAQLTAIKATQEAERKARRIRHFWRNKIY